MISRHQIGDYLTTVMLAAIPIVVANQDAIGKMVPVEYVLLFTIGMGVLSQLAANARVQKAKADVVGNVDLINAAIDDKQAKLAELQGELDKYQEVAAKVVADEPIADALTPEESAEVIPDPDAPHQEIME